MKRLTVQRAIFESRVIPGPRWCSASPRLITSRKLIEQLAQGASSSPTSGLFFSLSLLWLWFFLVLVSGMSCWLCSKLLIHDICASHLCKDYPYNIVTWNLEPWDDNSNQIQGHSFPSFSEWWDEMIVGKARNIRRGTSGLLYVIWNIWKERNRCIFTGSRMTFVEVASCWLPYSWTCILTGSCMTFVEVASCWFHGFFDSR